MQAPTPAMANMLARKIRNDIIGKSPSKSGLANEKGKARNSGLPARY
jgi:hypothetical protein